LPSCPCFPTGSEPSSRSSLSSSTTAGLRSEPASLPCSCTGRPPRCCRPPPGRSRSDGCGSRLSGVPGPAPVRRFACRLAPRRGLIDCLGSAGQVVMEEPALVYDPDAAFIGDDRAHEWTTGTVQRGRLVLETL